MYRRRSKDGNIQRRGSETTIAGESIYKAVFGNLSRKSIAEFQEGGKELLIMGMYDYCDGLGNYSKRMFTLAYDRATVSAALRFRLISDIESPIPQIPIAGTESLSPCETFAEREQRQKDQNSKYGGAHQ